MLYQARRKRQNLLMVGTKKHSILIQMMRIFQKKKVRSQVAYTIIQTMTIETQIQKKSRWQKNSTFSLVKVL